MADVELFSAIAMMKSQHVIQVSLLTWSPLLFIV